MAALASTSAAAMNAGPGTEMRCYGAAAEPTNDAGARWICTTRQRPWQSLGGVRVGPPGPNPFDTDLGISLDQPQQSIDGFGGAFTEKGWQALQSLPAATRAQALGLAVESADLDEVQPALRDEQVLAGATGQRPA